MPRPPRIDVGGYVYHVINRANGRVTIFHNEKDYQLFEELLEEAKEQFGMRIVAYSIMPNHWHLLLYSLHDGDIGTFMHWLTTTHATRYHAEHKTIGGGHVYQGRYKSFLVDSDRYVLSVLKYIERNPARAKLVGAPEMWKWGSAYRRISGSPKEKSLLAVPPAPLPHQYRKWINQMQNDDEVMEIRKSVNNGAAYGDDMWKDEIVLLLKKKSGIGPL